MPLSQTINLIFFQCLETSTQVIYDEFTMQCFKLYLQYIRTNCVSLEFPHLSEGLQTNHERNYSWEGKPLGLPISTLYLA